MGLSCDAALSVGYTIDVELIPDRYYKAVARQTHWEDRFDPRTGRKLPSQVEIVDQEEGAVWIWQGQECEDLNDFLDAVAKAAGGCHGHYGEVQADPAEGLHRIELLIPEAQGDYTGCDFTWLAGQLKAVQALGKKLQQLGFVVDPPTAAAYLIIG